MQNRRKNNGAEGIVYSTQQGGEMCPACGNPRTTCSCPRKNAASVSAGGDGIVRVGRETKGRKGKGVTVITGAPLALPELIALCTYLKKKCGSGGALKDNGVIEIQGEHRDVIVQELAGRGWLVKRVGDGSSSASGR